MRLNSTNLTKWDCRAMAAWLLLALTCIACCAEPSSAATKGTPSQTTYITPEDAGKALLAAMRTSNEITLAHVLGPQAKTILSSGDPAEDTRDSESFVEKYVRMHRWVRMTDGSRVLYIGADNYHFPIPLGQDPASQWYFNTTAGEDELVARRIGKNELLAIDACNSIANAEELYRHKGQYTQKILSSSGKQDGLFWEVPEDQAPSPLGRLGDFAKLALSSATDHGSPVFDGYAFRILTAQGEKAKGGAISYVVDGKMSGGFAVIARPVKYQDSGIMTFILSREGVVYQRDLGENTAERAASIHEYNPTDEWNPAE